MPPDDISRDEAHRSRDELRQRLRAARRNLSAREVSRGSQRIVRSLHGALPLTEFETVALYWPVGNEVDVRGLAASEVLPDHVFALPVVEEPGAALSFRSWTPGDPVKKGAHGESVPVRGEIVVPQLVLVPLVGFDRRGHRLGQGGGYYDRTLAKLRASNTILAVGLAFSVQECLNISRESHDEPLDRVVTEQEVIVF